MLKPANFDNPIVIDDTSFKGYIALMLMSQAIADSSSEHPVPEFFKIYLYVPKDLCMKKTQEAVTKSETVYSKDNSTSDIVDRREVEKKNRNTFKIPYVSLCPPTAARTALSNNCIRSNLNPSGKSQKVAPGDHLQTGFGP